MEDYSDSDTSSESEFESDQESLPESDYDLDECYENLELDPSDINQDEYASWNPEAQLQAEFDATYLAQLHANIKARVQILIPTYQKLPWS